MNFESDNREALQTAMAKRAQGRGLKNSEIGLLSRAARPAPRPLSNNYRPLGANPNQINDRIHTLQDLATGSGQSNELHYNRGGVKIDIDGAGISVQNSSYTVVVNPSLGKAQFTNVSTGKALTIDLFLLDHNMGIVEIDVCDGGVDKKMLVLASAAY